MIYFDQAATSWPKPPSVTEALTTPGLGNPSRGAHEFALAANRVVAGVRNQVAEFFNHPSPERVIFTKNVTEALNIAVNSLEGHLITTEAEHNSVLRPVYRHGDFTVAEVDDRGRYQVESISAAINERTSAVVVAHASNVTGNLGPLAAISALCQERNLLLIVDAAQTAGLFPIDLATIPIDALCFTGHKALYGPQGTGGLCLSPRFTPKPLLVGGSGHLSFELEHPRTLPEALEAGTPNVPGLAALGAGLTYLQKAGEHPLKEAMRLATGFYDALSAEKNLIFYGDYQAPERAPIVTLNIDDWASDEVAQILAEEYGLAVRSGFHCAPLLHKRFKTELQGAVRFSFSHFNTETEVDLAIRAIKELARQN